MKIALLHGAVLNAGDFLIKERTEKLLKYFYPQCEINEFYRNVPLDDRLAEINENDIMILAGGPGYNTRFYPELVPLVENIDDIKIPIMFLGRGWYGTDNTPFSIYNTVFNEKYRQLLLRASRDSHILGCRDFYSVQVLRNNGFKNALMTGCPAWYDLSVLEQVKYTGKGLENVSTICISNPQGRDIIKSVLKVIVCLRQYFGKDVTIKYVTHRGIDEELMKVIGPFMDKQGVAVVDISGSADGFKVYDDCDLHVGFRVHSHIYNLSKRRISVLLEEDSRGLGVNEALGLPHISPYMHAYFEGKIVGINNDYMTNQLECYLDELKTNQYIRLENAFQMMRKYFNNMEKSIQSIEEIIGKGSR